MRHREATASPRPRRSAADDSLVVRGLAITYPAGTVVLPTEPGWDHLIYASAGVMTVETASGTWVLPSHRALWAPDGTPFRILVHGRVSVRALYFRRAENILTAGLQVFHVPGLVRELILAAVADAPLDWQVDEDRRMIQVLADRLKTLEQAPLELPMPSDPRALTLAQRLSASGVLHNDLDHAARDSGASKRTLERIFAKETGMSIGKWRRRMLLIEALRRLANGETATTVASAIGYATPSAFSYAFRQQLGESPTRYFKQS